MDLTVKQMDKSLAMEILKWNYESPYDLYNNEFSDEALAELLDGSYQALIDEGGAVFGFFCIGKSAQVPVGHEFGVYKDTFVDMGLGMNPQYVGQGNGYAFCSFIIDYIKQHHEQTPIRLTVATFNHRAIHLYEKLGFKKKETFNTETTEFITMVKQD